MAARNWKRFQYPINPIIIDPLPGVIVHDTTSLSSSKTIRRHG
jgi:hypothetical protein